MPLAVVYLGEHYFVDALAGLAAAAIGWELAGTLIAARSRAAGAKEGEREPAPVVGPDYG
jgi:hypothetical protein